MTPAGVAEQADAPALGAGAFGRRGSTPLSRTVAGDASPGQGPGLQPVRRDLAPAAHRPALEHLVDDPLGDLTPREREVLELMAEGRSNSGIAERLVITERAVEKHVTSIFGKLRLPTASEDHRRVLAVLTFLRA